MIRKFIGGLVAGVILTCAVPLHRAEAQDNQGCCAAHGGVLGCNGTQVVCRDGLPSPTCLCKAPRVSAVRWTLSGHDGLMRHTGLFQPSGAVLQAPLGWTCTQDAPKSNTTAAGDRFETVAVTCKQSLGAEVSLLVNCFVDHTDTNASTMVVKSSLGTGSFFLMCHTP